MSKKENSSKVKKKKEKKFAGFDEFLIENTVYYTKIPDYYKNRVAYSPPNEKILRAFIPGTIREMKVKVGDVVNIGDSLMILEAMKMNNEVKALIEGKVKAIFIMEGDMVRKNQEIVEFE